MSFLRCIDQNVKAGKLSEKKAQKAKNAWLQSYDAAKKTMSEAAALDHAAIKAVESITKLNQAKTWARVNELRKTAMLMQMMSKSDRPDHVLVDIGDRLELAQRRVIAQGDAIIVRAIEEHRPRFAGLYRPTQHSRNIIDAIYGDNVSDEAARAMAKDYVKLHEFYIRRANMEGASIEIPPKGRLGIIQDSHKMRKRETAIGQAAAKEEWINDHIDAVDWTLLDKELAEEAKHDILSRRYETFITEGNSNRASGFHSAALSERLNGKNRILYYKDAKSWHYINDKYGAGNPYQQMISERETWSKDIALLEIFGPNPQMMLQHLTRSPGGIALARAAEVSAKGGKDGRTIIDRTKKEATVLKNRFDIHSHLVANGEHSPWIQGIATTRSLAMTAVLSSAFIANLGDAGFGIHQSAVLKIPAMGYLGKTLKTFASMPSAEMRKHALRSGLIGDGMTEMALNAQRYLGAFDGYHAARMISDVTFRAQGLNAWTQASRWTWGNHLMGAFADHADRKFASLPFREVLEKYNITSREWDLFRSTKINDERGLHNLRPIDLANRTDIDKVVAQRVSDKFFDFINDTGKRAVPSIDTRVQQSLGGALPADTFAGQIMRTFGALKSFPMFIVMMHLRDGFMQATPKGKLGYVASLTLMMTIMGAAITQMKDLARGRDPRDMTDPNFWGRAVLNGGSLGFLGDALFSGVNSYRGGGLADVFSGPYTEYLSSVRDIAIGIPEAIVTGEDPKVAKKLTDFGATYFPLPWPAKLAAERLIVDEIMQWADPRAHKNALRRENRRRKELGQKSWWRPYEKSPSRAPDWGAVVGGSK